MNTACAEWLGYPSASPRDLSIWYLLHPRSHKTALTVYLDACWHGHDRSATLQFMSYDNQAHYGDIRLKPAPFAGDGAYMLSVHPVATYDQLDHLSHLNIGIYCAQIDGQLTYANPTLTQLLGFDHQDDLLRHSIYDFCVRADAGDDYIARWVQTGVGDDVLRLQGRDGTRFWVRHRGRVLFDDDDTPMGIRGGIEDIDDVYRQKQMLERINDELRTLNAISFTLQADKPLREILDSILLYAQQLVPYETASVMLVEDDALRVFAFRGRTDPDVLSNVVIPLDQTIIARHDFQESIRLADITQAPEWIPVADLDHIKGWIGVPLRHQDELLGMLSIDHSHDDFFTEQHQRHAEMIAMQASLVIKNVRLHQMAKEEINMRQTMQEVLELNLIQTQTLYWILQMLSSASEMDAGTLADVLNMTASALGHTDILLIVFDEQAQTLYTSLQSNGSPHDIWATFCELNNLPTLPQGVMPPEPLAIDEWAIKTRLTGEQAITAKINQHGALIAIREPDAPPFDIDEQDLVATVASQLNIAIQNYILRESLREHRDMLDYRVRQRTRQLNLANKRLQAILDATGEGIFYMENFVFQYANPAFCKMVGYELDELYGKSISFVRVQDQTQEPLPVDVLDMGHRHPIEPGSRETRLRHRDGHEFYVYINYELAGDFGQDPVRMVAIVRDISKERDLFFQRARFIANAAHELRNPLSSLGLRLHMLRRSPQNLDRYLDKLDQTYTVLKNLVDQLFDLARFERGAIQLELGEGILQDLIAGAIDSQRTFIQEKEANYQLEIPEEPIPMICDTDRIQQSVQILIQNAINYIEDGGNIDINVEIDATRNTVVLTVRDDGIGIDPELLPEQIFTPFSRPSQGNSRETGMGLAIMREIVTLHNGTVTASNRPEGGSQFLLVLPLS